MLAHYRGILKSSKAFDGYKRHYNRDCFCVLRANDFKSVESDAGVRPTTDPNSQPPSKVNNYPGRGIVHWPTGQLKQ